MAARYLLDTNSVSYLLRGGHPNLAERVAKMPIGRLAVSAITEAELLFGIERRPEATRLKLAVNSFLERVESIAWGTAAATEYAQVRSEAEKSGSPIGSLDMLIAAHALSLSAVLISSDHVFRRINGLKLEDWTKK